MGLVGSGSQHNRAVGGRFNFPERGVVHGLLPVAVYFCASGGTGLASRFVCLCGCADVEVLVFFARRF